ncbi:hypothetical protein HMPREF3196_00881 [Bifidobacterium bifidum]|uniref:Uncharacterized protein n=1 Tax=Bifidobacterium bifidum TaxID=1681 RepID=A0A133KQH8_BIFBI|nr:hypothetical protein HMPREF3196_00881 [Bifidobacterium bifidum]
MASDAIQFWHTSTKCMGKTATRHQSSTEFELVLTGYATH